MSYSNKSTQGQHSIPDPSERPSFARSFSISIDDDRDMERRSTDGRLAVKYDGKQKTFDTD